MSRKVAGRVHHQRECAYCHGGIAEQRPVFLLASETGAIMGPFHAGCAEKLKLAVNQLREMPDVPGATNYGTILKPREETLPW